MPCKKWRTRSGAFQEEAHLLCLPSRRTEVLSVPERSSSAAGVKALLLPCLPPGATDFQSPLVAVPAPCSPSAALLHGKARLRSVSEYARPLRPPRPLRSRPPFFGCWPTSLENLPRMSSHIDGECENTCVRNLTRSACPVTSRDRVSSPGVYVDRYFGIGFTNTGDHGSGLLWWTQITPYLGNHGSI